MKLAISKETLLLFIIVVAIFAIFGLGYYANDSEFNIEAKQNQLGELFKQGQANLEDFDALISELVVQQNTMQGMSNLNDAELSTLESIPAQIEETSEKINQTKVFLANLQFAYAVLQEMR